MAIPTYPPSYRPDPKITSLANQLSDPVGAADFPKTILHWRNDKAAATIGLSNLSDEAWIGHFGRFDTLPDNLEQPLALRYHGHQFRHYNPDIGDGRGFLFAQMRDDQGRLLDLGTKGSGQTPYSRDGDGRLTLKGAVRELLATEMLDMRGVPTSQTFSIIETGEELWRGDEPSPTRSAILVRLSHSHIRIGTFQRLAYLEDAVTMAQLVDYVLRELYDVEPSANTAIQLFELVVPRLADLAASYMMAGFVHGVLNSDNINVTGESFDYGPWRFTEFWDPNFTAAYFDHAGLYAFGRQAEAMHWNAAQLAISLRLICDAPPLIKILETFPGLYQQAILRRFLARLGVKSAGEDADRKLVELAEKAMIAARLPIDLFFHTHHGGGGVLPISDHEAYQAFLKQLESHDPDNVAQRGVSYDVPCSILIDEVEAIWKAIAEADDWQPLFDKLHQIRSHIQQ